MKCTRPDDEAAAAETDPMLRAKLAKVATPQSCPVQQFEVHVKHCQLQAFSFDYYMHGLVEEAGEVFEAVRATRSAEASSLGANDNVHSVLSELGDVLWYTTSLSMEVGGDLTMPESWPVAEAGAIEPEVFLLAAVARLSGRVKKSMRGDKPLAQFVPSMAEHRNDLLLRCAEVAANHQATLQQCALMNIHKLSGRFERNTVRGDGENR